MTMTLSSATAAAKAAKAELTAPVASNHGGLDGMPTSAPNRNADANTGSRVPPKSAPLTGNNKNPITANGKPQPNGNSRTPLAGNQPAPAPRSATPSSQNDPVSYPGRAQGEPAADEAASVAPLFSQLLNLADQVAAGAELAAVDSGTDSGGDGTADSAAGSGSASAASLVPAMFGNLLAQAVPLAAPAPAAGGDNAARTDAVGATATLNSAATRLNLSAVGVAVTPAAPPSAAAQAADDGAAAAAAQAAATPAPVSAAPAGTPQNIYAMANSAALGAQVQQSQSDAPAPAPAASAAAAASAAPAPTAAPAPAADSAAFTPALPRALPRSADLASAPAADYSASAAAASGAVKDDSITRSSAPTPAPVAGNVGFSQAAPAATPAAAVVKLAGSPEQWQQPLREALGDRLQVQLQRNNDHAVIRLEPPNMGSIEISIRHSGGSLQVNLSANHSEVLRQLNTIGDSVRQDLSTRQYADVSVTVSSSRAQAQADTGGRGGQQREQEEGRTPGRALSGDEATTFAMTSERE